MAQRTAIKGGRRGRAGGGMWLTWSFIVYSQSCGNKKIKDQERLQNEKSK